MPARNLLWRPRPDHAPTIPAPRNAPGLLMNGIVTFTNDANGNPVRATYQVGSSVVIFGENSARLQAWLIHWGSRPEAGASAVPLLRHVTDMPANGPVVLVLGTRCFGDGGKHTVVTAWYRLAGAWPNWVAKLQRAQAAQFAGARARNRSRAPKHEPAKEAA